ncbi:MAG TPA: MFS transporter [Thermomonospora sp.]|nr:MFS transporter [Thermomonospora sp.]
MPVALVALAICAFGIGTTEFVINGLQTGIAADLGVSVSRAGLLVAGFAAGIIVGAPVTAALGVRVRRRDVLLAAMALFTAANLAAALAPGYGTLMAARVLGGVSVGAFYGVGSVVAADLVPPDRRARAIALMFAGATAGTTLGVPAGTFLGQVVSWRATFGVLTVVGVLAFAAVAALVPAGRPGERPGLRAELAALRDGRVLTALLVTAAVFGAVTTTYAYIEPLLREVTGYSSGAVAVLLLVLGAGLFAGNLVGGRAADRALVPALATGFAVFAVVLAVTALTAHSRAAMAVMVFLFGAAGYALVPGAQLWVLTRAGNAPTLASATNISAFNVGVVGGSWLGGVTIDAGLGYASVAWDGAAIALAGLLLVLASAARDRHRRASTGAGAERADAVPCRG